jgi:hypothetical protein
LVDDGSPVAQQILGHRAIETTTKYTHVAVEIVRSAIDKPFAGMGESSSLDFGGGST